MTLMPRTTLASPRNWNKLKWVALAVALAVVIYGAVGAIAANRLTVPGRQFTPARSPAAYGMDYQDVRFLARGGDVEIAAWYIPSVSANRAILLVHGKDSSRNFEFDGKLVEFAQALHQAGLAVLMIDLRGHGQSGDARYSFGRNERRDVEGAVDWLKGAGFAPSGIGVLGVSMGAASAIGATADDADISALVEDSGYAELYPVIQKQWNSASGLPSFFLPSTLWMYRVMYGFDLASLRPVDEISRIAPRGVLIIHGTADAMVPASHADQLKAAAPLAEIWKVDGGEHARLYNANPQMYSARVIDFFSKHLK